MGRLLDRIRIGIAGLGWVGQEVARAALEDPRVRLVGVADTDPAKANRDLGEIIGEGRLGLPIDPSIEAMLARARPEVAVLCTTSDVEKLGPTLEACVAHGAHVVTTCENLADPELALAQLEPGFEQRVRESGLVVLATGVNPGFAMDRLPVMLTQATRNIRRVRVVRVVNASLRRSQLQQKIGVGMKAHDFTDAVRRGEVGHAGLSSSLRLLAKGLGIVLEKTSEAFTPLIAERETSSSVLGPVQPGAVRGIYQIARGYRARREVITLELTMALDEPNPRDTIDIVGEPPLHFEGELPGDSCTVATMLSAISVIVTMPAGLRTVLDVPLEQPEEPATAKEPMISSRKSRAATQLPEPAQGGSKERPKARVAVKTEDAPASRSSPASAPKPAATTDATPTAPTRIPGTKRRVIEPGAKRPRTDDSARVAKAVSKGGAKDARRPAKKKAALSTPDKARAADTSATRERSKNGAGDTGREKKGARPTPAAAGDTRRDKKGARPAPADTRRDKKGARPAPADTRPDTRPETRRGRAGR